MMSHLCPCAARSRPSFLPALCVALSPFPARPAEGEWQEFDDGGKKRHGFGRFRHGGESYEGQWSEGHIHGRGCYRFASGAVYDGEWVSDRFEGRGSYRWPSGAQYNGEWAHNKMHGLGAFLAHTGDRYQGVFHNDRFKNAQGHWIAPMQQTEQQRTIG